MLSEDISIFIREFAVKLMESRNNEVLTKKESTIIHAMLKDIIPLYKAEPSITEDDMIMRSVILGILLEREFKEKRELLEKLERGLNGK